MQPAVTADDLSDDALGRLSEAFEHEPAEAIVAWAAQRFGDGLVVTASMADAVLIDVASRARPGIEVVFCDTQYHFAETLGVAEAVRVRYPVRLTVTVPDVAPDERWRTDTDGCCRVRKVEPLDRALAGKQAWLSGLRRADSPERATTPILQRDRRGLVKVNPLATWGDDDIEAYIVRHDVLVNPLLSEYPSIGCWPCTSRPAPGEHARAGRWAGSAKTECGLHL